MVQAHPAKPPGDVAATWAMIRALQGDRQGVVALRRSLASLLDESRNLEGFYMLPIATYRIGAMAEADAAVAGVDAAIAAATAAVRRLERDLAEWKLACQRIDAASS
jgi:hypothetical protein